MENQDKRLSKEINHLTHTIKELNHGTMVQLLENPKRYFFFRFTGGIAAGLGGAIGATIILALTIYLLQKVLNVVDPQAASSLQGIFNNLKSK